MKLLRLVLQGFKSFADRTEISFSDGMTMIVGPNGCGKSNISDAVRWVLGEQNVRNLRGQKAEDVIFAGSLLRKAKNGAEVTMVLDNSARELPIDTAEVSVTRRVLRNGESDFYINQRACRLKDIQELFATTGLGKGSLAIIGQNRVDQVLSARPEERRLIFEEVAGISRYRMRKEEGLGKLKRTEDNMDRVRDLMAVLEEQLGPMEEAARRAKTFRELLKEKQAAEATASLLKLTSLRRMLARYETEKRDLTDKKSQWDTKCSSLDAERAAIEEKGASQEGAYRKAAAAAADFSQDMEKIHGDYRVKEVALTHCGEEIRRLGDFLSEESEKESTLHEAAAQAEMDRKAADETLTAEKRKVLQAETDKAEAEKALGAAEKEHAGLLADIQKKTAQKERIAQDQAYIGENLRRIQEELEAGTEVRKTLAHDADTAKKALADLEQAGTERASKMDALTTRGKEESAALKAGENRAFSLMNQWNEARSCLAQITSQRNYLTRAEKEYANFSNTTRTVLGADEPWQDHIRGPLGDLLRVPGKYTDAAEAALGGTVSYIVTDTAKTAGAIISWMKQRNAGRTTFYPLDAMKPRYSDHLEREAAAEPGVCGIASDLFGCDPDIEDLKKALLGRLLIVENLDTARNIAKKYRYRLHLVTLDGQILRPGGSMTGGSMRKRENTFFGRKREIEALLEKEKITAGEIQELEQKRKDQDEKNAELSDAVSRSREAWQALHVEEAADQARKEGLKASVRRAEEALANAGVDTEKKKKEEESLLEKQQALQKEWEKLGDIPKEPEDSALLEARKRAEEAGATVTTLLVNRARAEEALRRAVEVERDRAAALQEAKKRRAEAEAEKTAREKEQESVKEEMAALHAQFEEKKKALKAAETERDELQNGADAIAIARSENDKARRAAQDTLFQLEKTITEKQMRIDDEARQEKEELAKLQMSGLTERAAEEQRLPGNSTDMTRKVADLNGKIDALGVVNPNAESEYALEAERFYSYETQLEDLEKAKEGLMTVIREIDTTMSSQFTEAFSKINEEFGRIMNLMFQGGHGRLELTDPAKPLECGVELYLDLPGKKRQPLTLMSGGERALTVIALLISFLAYRPAPFCFVDEIDAALDDANVERFSKMMAEYKKRAQFIVITHRKKTMEFADTLQGVTMGEKGVSSLITVKMEDYVE